MPKTKEKGYTLAAFQTANRIALTANKSAYIFYILLSLLTAAGTYVSLRSAEYTVTSAYNLFTGKAGFTAVVIGVSVFSAAGLLFYIIGTFASMLRRRLSLDITYTFENALNDKLSGIKWDYYESNGINLKIHEVQSHTLEKIQGFVDSTVQYVTTIPLTFIYCYFLFQLNAWFVLIYFVLILLCNIAGSKMFNKTQHLWEEIQPYSQRENYFFSLCGEKVSHQEYVFNRLYKYTSDKWEDSYNKEYNIRLKIFRNYEIILQSARIIINLPYMAMLIFISYEIAVGHVEIGYLAMANQLLNQVIDTFIGIYRSIAQNRIDSKFIRSYDEICLLEDGPSIAEPSGTGQEYSEIDLSGITYVYPQSEYKALNNLSWRIKRGEKIAVVGVNGSGKTTCMNLLLSLTDNFEGSITACGKENIDLKNSVSCILQDFVQYQMTIKENIEVGFADKEFSEDEIWRILDKVGMKEFVRGLEKGIYTPLGQLENGIELSKGQWQRLAIARLLANPDAKIWILDEPTAYLDPISETRIYDMIYKLSEDKTVLFISHRLGFAKAADKIVLFEGGHIQEEGTHSELVKRGGIYAEMYANQREWYTDSAEDAGEI